MIMREDDLRIDVFNCLVPGPDQYAVRIVHTPTGMTETATGEYRIETRERAMAALLARLDSSRPDAFTTPDSAGEGMS